MQEENLSIIEMMDESVKRWEQEIAEGRNKMLVEQEAWVETSNNLYVVKYQHLKRCHLSNLINFEAVDAWKTLLNVVEHVLSTDEQLIQPGQFEQAAELVWTQINKYEGIVNEDCRSMETFLQNEIIGGGGYGLDVTCLHTPIHWKSFREMIELWTLIPVRAPTDNLSQVTLTILLVPSAYTTDDLKKKVFPRTGATEKQIQNILRIQYLLLNYD